MISKELLGAVLNVVVENVHKLCNNELNYTVSMVGYRYINIYELTNKCKE